MTEEDHLDYEATKSLRGVQSVMDRLSNIMAAGSPSIKDISYAIKMRPKDDFKIREKVLKKRNEDKPNYTVKDIRDILGLRIVNLYRLDSLAVVPMLIDRIEENSGNNETNLFLENPIEEVHIYSVNPMGDAQNLPKRIESVFVDRGYGSKTAIIEKAENYTSTHVVAWCRGKYGNHHVPIPVEIQIRTALEDVWCEIDHQLKYKRDEKTTLTDSASAASVENCVAHLGVMKTLNDGLAQYGDQVKIQIDEIDERVKRSSRTRLAEEPTVRLSKFESFSGAVKDKICEALGESREVINDYSIDSYSGSSRNAKLLQVLDNIDKFVESDICIGLPDEGLKREVEYVFGMERALIRFELGKGLGKSGGNQYLLDAQQIYQRMESDFPDRGIIHYRLGKVLAALNNKSLGVDKLNSLVENFHNTDLNENHWVKASALRLIGFFRWEEASKLKENNGDKTNFRSSGDESQFRALTLEAVDYSIKASNVVVERPPEPNEVPHESDRKMSVSNVAFFIVEFLENGGKWEGLMEIGVDETKFQSYLAELSQFETDSFIDYRKANTLRRAYSFLGNIEKALEFANLAVKSLEALSFYDRGGKTAEEKVLRECKRFLHDQSMSVADRSV